jgi:putative membrane protein
MRKAAGAPNTLLFGAATVSRRILYVQAGPAALALLALWAGW